ncbi:YdcF family protein [Bacillus marinisedimentorum]|uniref:YdcF family protein n=1 Tax=Bacillus marinisedimentorum TaxID=1821260 RepID=UPI0007DF6253|nr:YdcF family protein [Bacillus marinisedimentorum]
MKKKLRIAVAAPLALVLIFFLWSGFEIWRYSNKDAESVTADAAVVLGAASWNGKPSPVFQGRIDHAVNLYKSGKVEHLIFTGGKAPGSKLSEAETGKRYAIGQGVRKKDIFLENKSGITEQNLLYAGKIAEEQMFNDLLIITDPLHMKRAMAMAEDLGLDAFPSPASTTAYKSAKTKVPFFLRELVFYTGYELVSPFRSFGKE